MSGLSVHAELALESSALTLTVQVGRLIRIVEHVGGVDLVVATEHVVQVEEA